MRPDPRRPLTAEGRARPLDAGAVEVLLLLLLVALGLFMRVWGNWEYALNPDEAMHAVITRDPGHKGVWFQIWHLAHPPLMFWLVHLLGNLDPGVLSLRCVAFLPGTLLILVSYLLGRSACGSVAGLAMAALAAFGSGPVFLSQLVRPYALLLFFVTAAFWLLLEYLRTRDRRLLYAYSLCATLAICSHYVAVIPLAALTAAWAARAVFRMGGRAELVRLAAFSLPPLAALGVLYSLQLSFMGPAVLSIGYYGKFLPETSADFARKALDVFAYLFSADHAGWFLALAAAGAVWLWTSSRRLLLLIVGGTFLISIALTFARKYPLGYSRHSAFLFPMLALLIGAAAQGACDLVVRRVRPALPDGAASRLARLRGPGLAFLACVAAGLSLALTTQYRRSDFLRRLPIAVEFTLTRSCEDRLFAHLAARARPGDRIVTNMMTWHRFSYDSVKRGAPLASARPIDIKDVPYQGRFGWENSWRGVGCIILARYDFSDLLLRRSLRAMRKNALVEEGATVWLVNSGWKKDAIGEVLSREPFCRSYVRREFAEGASSIYAIRVADIGRLPARGGGPRALPRLAKPR